MSRVLVTGAGGFIAGHLVAALLDRGCEVVAVDVKPVSQWWQWHRESHAYGHVDLRNHTHLGLDILKGVDTVINLAANMGGMGFIADNPAACMENVLISANLLRACVAADVQTYLFASSACVYNESLQQCATFDAFNPPLRETDAYPANPDTDYGWEKLYSERMAQAFASDYGLSVRLPRIHNCYGPHGTWQGGREKAPAAICRKVAEAVKYGKDSIEVWGDGEQTRSFMWIGDCVDGLLRLLDSDVSEPINLGSDRLVTINQLVDIVEGIAGVTLERVHVDGPQGVRGRCSDNTLIRERLGWEPSTSLEDGLRETYGWIEAQV